MRKFDLLMAFAIAFGSASASMASELTIYTPWTADKLAALQTELDRRDMDIKLNIFRSGAVELDTVFTTEMNAGLQKADYVMANTDILEVYKGKGWLHQLSTQKAEDYIEGTTDPDGYWASVEVTPIFIVYNTKKLEGDAIPRKWVDLADPRYKDIVGMSDPRTTTSSQYPLTYWTSVLNKELGEPPYGWTFIEKLAENKPVLATGSAQLADLVITGEIAVSAIPLSHVYNHLKAGEPIAIALPEEGLPISVLAGSVVENAPNREDAIKLHDFFSSQEGQQFIAETIGTTVGHRGVEQALPNGSKMNELKLVPVQFTPELQKENTRHFIEAMGL